MSNLRKPQTFWERVGAKLHWLWSPQDAEKKWQYREPREFTEITQEFTVHLVDGTALTRAVTASDAFLWDERTPTIPAATQHEWSTQRFLERAGQYGTKIDGVFYPHSRIDKIVPGDKVARKVMEGDLANGKT